MLVHFMLCRQLDDNNDDDPNIPLVYHMWGDNYIRFGREEFCLVTGLRFGNEYSDEYGDFNEEFPFRRRVFPSCLDGSPITGADVYWAIDNESFDSLDDEDAVNLCCLGIVQLVLLGKESTFHVPPWMLRLVNNRFAWNQYPWGSYVWPTLYQQLRNANYRRWSALYAS